MSVTRDMASNIAIRESVRPAANTNTTGETVDVRGFSTATAVIAVGALGGSGNVTPRMEHSVDGSTNWETVTAGDLLGAFPAALVANTTYKVGYRGPRRYVRLAGTLNSGTNASWSGVFVLGQPALAPTA
jgi:hypothetical protein